MDTITNETIDKVNTMSESISEYGILIVLASVFILLIITVFFILMKSHTQQVENTLKSNDELMRNLVDQNNQLIQSLSTIKNKCNNAKEEEEDSLVKKYLDVNIGLRSICKNIMSKLNAFRVSVYVFHNGNKSAHGLPFFKLSCIAEWVKSKNMINNKSQIDIPLYLLYNIVHDLYNSKSIFINNNSKDHYDNIEIILSDYDNQCALYGILDKYENLAGFILIEFDKYVNIDKKEVHDKFLSVMEEESQTISDIIIFTNMENKSVNIG